MKRLYLLTIVILISACLNAQDTLVKLNGDQISCKIIDVYPMEIKYTKFDFQDGPIYVENKSNVRLIKYSNGTQEEFSPKHSDTTLKASENHPEYSTKPINPKSKIEADGKGFWYNGKWLKEREMHNLLLSSNDQQIKLLVNTAKKSKRLKNWGYAIIPLALVGNIFVTNLNDPESRDVLFDVTGASLCFSGAIAFSITTVYFKRKHHAANREAIKLYSEKY